MASQISSRLAARGDPASDQFISMVNNITGGMAACGASGNQKALDVLQNGFKNKPAHDYYRAGDPPTLPQALVDAGLSAQILGPPGDLKLISQLTNAAEQYLTDAMQEDDEPAKTFPNAFRAKTYPSHAFKIFAADKVKAMIDGMRPDVLAARAQAADKPSTTRASSFCSASPARICCSPATPNGATGKISCTAGPSERPVTPT